MDYSTSEQQQRLSASRGSEREIRRRRRRRRAGNFYPIFFVSLQSTVQKVPRHFLVFVQPLNDKWLEPPAESRKDASNFKQEDFHCFTFTFCLTSCYSRRIFRHSALEEGQVFAVLVVQPLDLEVQVHVICALTQAIFFMF